MRIKCMCYDQSCIREIRLQKLNQIEVLFESCEQQLTEGFCPRLVLSSVMSDSLRPPWPARLLCPWDSPGQEYWSGLPFPSPGDLSNPRIKPLSPVSPALQADSSLAESSGKPIQGWYGSFECQLGMQVVFTSCSVIFPLVLGFMVTEQQLYLQAHLLSRQGGAGRW